MSAVSQGVKMRARLIHPKIFKAFQLRGNSESGTRAVAKRKRTKYRTIGLVEVFKNRGEGAANRNARTVQRMDKILFAIGAFDFDVHAARLEVREGGTRRDLAPTAPAFAVFCQLAGHPHF